MDNATPDNFEQLPLARTEMPAALAGQYRVYTDSKNFTRVEADSAVRALEASGYAKAFKIERETLHKISLLLPNFGAAAAPAAELPAT